MKAKFKPNRRGIGQMLREEPVGLLQEAGARARAAAQSLDPAARYNVKTYTAGTRATVLVGTTDPYSQASNADNDSLAKALGGLSV